MQCIHCRFEGHFDIVRALHAAGAPVRHRNLDGHDVVDILGSVHNGKRLCDVGLPDEDGLLQAAEHGDVELLRRCIASGTPLDARNEAGVTAIALASYFQSTPCLRVLAEHKADPNIVGDNGAVPLLLAVHEGHQDVVEALTRGCGTCD